MDYKTIILEALDERIKIETNSSTKASIIKLKKILETESLYKAAIYDYVYLRPQGYSHEEMYKIPEIHQAFIDIIKNPSLSDINPDQMIDIVYPFTRYISQETLLADQELMALIPDLTFEQAKKLFSGPEAQALLNNKKIYDIIASKAKEDERYYSIMIYNSYSIEDGSVEFIVKQDRGGTKLSRASKEDQLTIIAAIKTNVDIDFFLSNIATLDPEVQKAILSSQVLSEQLIILQSENKGANSVIPKESEADIVAKHLNFIKELSYEQKLNFIYKMQDAAMQKYLMKTLNFTKNLVSHTDSYSFYEGIKDKDYLVEVLCNLEILKSIGRFYFKYVIPKLDVETQRKIYQNEIFQEYIRKHVYARDIMSIIATFDETIIDEFLPLLKKVEIFDYLNLFTETKNKKYLVVLINELNAIKETKPEEYDEYIKYIANTLIKDDYAALLSEEQFEYLNSNSTSVNNIEETLRYLDKTYLPPIVQEKDKKVLKEMNKDYAETKEEINAVIASRRNKHHEDQLSNAIEIIKQTNDRVIKRLGYEILNRATPEVRQILLDRMTLEGLIVHLPASPHFIDYVYNLYNENPNIFDNIKLSSEDRVSYSDENLPEPARKKLIELFFLVPNKVKNSLLKGNFIEQEEIKKYIKEKSLTDPNFFDGNLYINFHNIFTIEELKTILEKLSLQNIISYFSQSYFSFSWGEEDKIETTRNEILLKRKDEIIHEININTHNEVYSISTHNILNSLYKVAPDKKEFLASLNPTLLLEAYVQHPSNESDKTKNQYIIDILKKQPNVLINSNENRVKRVLSTLPKKDFENLLSHFTVSDVIALLSKSQNKDTEVTLMTKFNENPYFINQTSQSLEEILNRLEDDNKNTIYQKIDEQFANLELPFGIKDKLRKLSYDEKIFLIYGVHENIFNEEKYQMIVKLLNKDPFALNSLNIELFRDDTFNISKNIIPKIYRYEELTINYIKLIKDNNVRSRILLLLVEHMNKCTPNETVFIQKLDTIIGYLTNRLDLTIDRYNTDNITEEDLHELEEYMLIDATEHLIETSILHTYNTFTDRPNGNAKTATEVEIRRIVELDEEMAEEQNIEKAKELYFKKYFKISTDQAEHVYKKYFTSIDTISKYIKNPEVLKLLSDIKIGLEAKTIEEINELYYSERPMYKIEDFLYMFDELNKAYNTSIANDIKGYKNGKEKALALVVDDETVIINAIELESDFDLFVHSTDAYGSMEMINNNYFDSWNYSDKTSNHGICTSYITNSNLGTAKVKGKGVMFGFVNLNQNSISSIAPYDLVSRNDAIITTSRRPPMYTDLKTLADYTRHTHNEAVLERRNVQEDSEYPVIQPDCIIIFEEMTDEIKSNAIRAQKDFKEQGIDLPIIYINKRKVIELEARKLDEMIKIYEREPNLTLLAEIINKYESNRCGLDFEENLNVEELFQKEKIKELILTALRQVKEVNNEEEINKFINLIAHEQYKFELIEETVGERAHSFDLLNENVKQELEILKGNKNTTSFDSNYSI